MNTNCEESLNAVAVIGMAGRFPGADSIEDFWEILCKGEETISSFADHELDPSIAPDLIERPDYIKARGTLKDAEMFDAGFFKITPREAEMMDPQQRIFLEVAWQGLEDSGYTPAHYNGCIGVYAGMGENTYFNNHLRHRTDMIETFGVHQTSLSNLPDYLATRVSYKFNLKGPAVNVATGCSTSLVAVCQGVDSLMSFQSDMVIAGGVFVSCPQNRGYLYQEGGILSADGHCRAFDQEARGTVFSNGAGVVVLKRLDEALNDGDHIYCVIRGTAMNNDGSERVSFTAPSVDGQAQVVALAHAAAGIDPETVTYIEAHGTGTPIGDPIEIRALTQAFRLGTEKKGFCALGSVKTNIGHLDAAAGIAGLIKSALCLKHGMLPPTVHFTTPNPTLDIENTPFYVNTALTRWDCPAAWPRRAGVSSFGVGGTNAHVVLEEAPAQGSSGASRAWQLLLLSGKTTDTLDRQATRIFNHLKNHPGLNPADAAYTLALGRSHFNCRRMAVVHTSPDGRLDTDPFLPESLSTASRLPVKQDVVFMFSGQGSQYVNMGLGLYQTEKTFQRSVDHCSEVLENHLGFDLRDVLYPPADGIKKAEALLKQTFVTQPALFVTEYALASLWLKWGVKPGAMVGHSIGEYVAACLSGVFSLEDALGLVARRGRLIQDLPGGTMMAVLSDEKSVREMIADALCLAVINGPALCVVSGESREVGRLENELARQSIHCRPLKTSHAFHSKMLDPVLDDFYHEVKNTPMSPPERPFVSNVSGTWITREEAMDPAYWVKHLRHTVRFADCIDLLTREEHRVFLEVGPGQTLASLVRQHPGKVSTQVVLSSSRRPDEQKSDSEFILNTLGHLWMNGFDVHWEDFYADEKRKRVPLPPYPFKGRRHWVEAGELSPDGAKPSSTDYENSEDPEALLPILQEAHGNLPEVQGTGTHVEDAVASIWKDILGVEDVGTQDNFFDLGGSSIVALSLFVRIEKVFGKKLPLATLYEAPTVQQMADILKKEEWSAPWSSLVPIHANGDGRRRPFFLMHSHGGNVLEYYPLAKKLGEDQPVYALQARGLDGNIVRQPSIETMAEYYIQEIRTVQPEGPYYLGGFCFGGLLALEAARQLEARGEEVALLALIQTGTREYSEYPPEKTFLHRLYFKLADRVGIELSNLSVLGPRAKVFYLFGRAKRFWDLARARFEILADPLLSRLSDAKKNRSMVYTLESLADAHEYAFQNYEAGPYEGKVVHFTAEKQPRGRSNDPTLGLGGVLNESARIHEVPGYRQTMLNPSNVGILAEKLKKCLDTEYRK